MSDSDLFEHKAAEARRREDQRVMIAAAILASPGILDKPWDRETKALEAVLLAEALLSALDPKR